MNELVTSNHIRIESANWRDLNELRALEKACFPQDAWPLLDLIGVLTFPNIIRIKAMIDGRLVGFIAGDVRPRENLGWISTVGVLPEFQRRGVASTLLDECEQRLPVERIRLNVRISNKAAIQLYLHRGYQHVSNWPNYYEDHEDALILEKFKPG